MKTIYTLRHSIILVLLLILNSQFSTCQYMDPQGTYLVAPVTNDTLIVFGSTGSLNANKYTTANGYFYVDYTALNAVDGTMQFGVIVNENGVNKFVPGTDPITLSNATTQITVNGVSKYLYQDVDGVRTWQLHVYIENLPGDGLAILYKKTSADNGSFNYKIKALR